MEVRETNCAVDDFIGHFKFHSLKISPIKIDNVMAGEGNNRNFPTVIVSFCVHNHAQKYGLTAQILSQWHLSLALESKRVRI